jgi:hypothetical protein
MSRQPDKLAGTRLEPPVTDDEGHHTADHEDGFVFAAVDVESGTSRLGRQP